MGDPFHPTATPGLVERAAAPAVELLDEAAGRAGVTPLRALLYTGVLATAVGGAQIAAGRSLSPGEVGLVVLAVLASTAWALAARHQTGRTRVALIVLSAATALWGLGRWPVPSRARPRAGSRRRSPSTTSGSWRRPSAC